MDNVASAFKDEPEWIIQQMLKSKRDEVVKEWKDREERLNRIRAKEKMMEYRGSKRRRVDDLSTQSNASGPEGDDEWLLDSQDGQETEADDIASKFSKETAILMQKLGMGHPKQYDDQEDRVEESLKV